MNKLLKACVQCGLNPYTGKSKKISLKALEKAYGQKLTGNGSKLRRDIKPFSYFNLDIVKTDNKVDYYQFNGFCTSKDMLDKLMSQIDATQDRILNEIAKTKSRVAEISDLPTNPNTLMYSYKDIK